MHDNVALPEPPGTLLGVTLHEVLLVVRATVPANPPWGVTVIIEVPAVPALTVTLVGLAETMKLTVTPTLNVTVAE